MRWALLSVAEQLCECGVPAADQAEMECHIFLYYSLHHGQQEAEKHVCHEHQLSLVAAPRHYGSLAVSWLSLSTGRCTPVYRSCSNRSSGSTLL